MSALNKKAFRLPRVERDKFILLMRLGLDYKRDQGVFCVSSLNNIEKLMDTLKSILNNDQVAFLQTCSVCSKDFACANCRYYNLCDTKNLPFHCVCPECLRGGKTDKDEPEQKKQMHF